MKLVNEYKNKFYKEKLKEKIGWPKELWKALKSLDLLCKKRFNLKHLSKKGWQSKFWW